MTDLDRLKARSLRDELAFLLDSTVDLSAESYDRDTLLMRLETACVVRESACRRQAMESAARIAASWARDDIAASIRAAATERVE